MFIFKLYVHVCVYASVCAHTHACTHTHTQAHITHSLSLSLSFMETISYLFPSSSSADTLRPLLTFPLTLAYRKMGHLRKFPRSPTHPGKVGEIERWKREESGVVCEL